MADTMKNYVEYATTIARLLGRAARCRLSRWRGAPLKPEALSLAVTGRCNSRCTMCNIALGVAALKERYLPRLRSLVITSNGLLPERVIANYRKILEGLRGRGIDLVAVASLDGIGATHDAIRGVKGAYKLAERTIGGLVELKREYPAFYPGVKTTVLPANIESLDEILDFATSRDLFYIISPAFFTEVRFHNADKREKLQLGEKYRERLARFYGRPEFDGLYFYSRLRRHLGGGGKGWACTAGDNYMFVEYDGTVYPCELINERLGNIREQPVEQIWHGAAARRWRKTIGRTAACRDCLEPGAVRYSAALGLGYPGFLAGLGPRRYRQSLRGEGYIKYLRK
jgi:MoaA/NifB/PqqE/SkfB family radical SAM enzyme